ncbi:BlaI/MecI/CopY family transcriptional regulator [Gracilimonas mengyeensis]|uniref:Predicted transcriptional regulator n=1 Tax=Gracilimonas mengyeensis TaxID=1302730 RepID=A0A521DC23_9BACT|nr:BlaI/MecI/CopY family transcriptional regulator [Gracilimonas mengyeensis]SMO69165.1 Predicted transcriptional regulator [Gracilimonas mengyeensis]
MRKSLTPLGESEMEILHHVWEMGEATVAQVKDRILMDRKVAYTTVMTIMKNLNDKGYLKYRKDGNTYVYSARKDPEEVQSSLVSGMIDKVFKGSTSALVQTLVKGENLSEKELQEIRKMIDDMED